MSSSLSSFRLPRGVGVVVEAGSTVRPGVHRRPNNSGAGGTASLPRTWPPRVSPFPPNQSGNYHSENNSQAGARLSCRRAGERVHGERAQPNPSNRRDNPMVPNEYEQQISSRPMGRVNSAMTRPGLCPSRIPPPGTKPEPQCVSVWRSAGSIQPWPLKPIHF